MAIVKYTIGRKFNVGQALKDGWEKDWVDEKSLIRLNLQDRKKSSLKATIQNVDWFMGIMRVHFKEGGWLCLDHAIEQFNCIDYI